MINILLADDHTITRKGLKIFTTDYVDHSVVDEAWDSDSVLNKISRKNYELIILDINMPNTDSIGLVSNIIATRPDSNILMLSMNAEEVYGKKFLMIGAKGYISKTASEKELKKAIKCVLNGKRYTSNALRKFLFKESIYKKSGSPFDKLSTREFEITGHLVRGESSGEICRTLSVHTSTLGTHKARIFEKLGCKNVIELNQLARIYNLVSPD